MDDHLEEKLDRLSRTVEEDHKMIRSLYVRARLTSILRIVYLFIIIGTAIGAYYFIDPYLQKVAQVYEDVKTTKSNFSSNGIIQFFQSFGDKASSTQR